MEYKCMTDITYNREQLVAGDVCDFAKLTDKQIAVMVEKGYIEPADKKTDNATDPPKSDKKAANEKKAGK